MRWLRITVAVLLVGVVACATRRADYPVWITQEGRTSTFQTDRDYIRSNCDVVRTHVKFLRAVSIAEMRAQAESLGANAVLTETKESERQEGSFYQCRTLPELAYH
jgi:hypothetical protein